jgi:myosin heavy subunit
MNDNLKPVAALSAEQRLFLKQQVGANVSRYDLQIKRDQAKLDSKLDRQAENKERNDALTLELQKKQTVLAALKQAGNVSADIIASQEEDVARAQKELDRLQTAPNTLTDVEAYFEQYEIEILKLAKKFYEDRVAELNAIP